jgi:hypothetical protein
MPKRPDGRIEPGQRLSTAISARAWNRAQDAADIVLGERTGFGAEAGAALPGALVVPCRVTTTVEGVMPGHVVEISGSDSRFPNLLAATPDTFSPSLLRLQGQVSSARQFNSQVPSSPNFDAFRTAYQIPVGVIVGGTTMPTPGTPQTVSLCVAGVCVARIRTRGSGVLPGGFFGFTQFGFVQPAFRRIPSDTAENLAGTFEITDTGTHRVLAVSPLNPRVVNDQVIDADGTWNTRVTWGVVLL